MKEEFSMSKSSVSPLTCSICHTISPLCNGCPELDFTTVPIAATGIRVSVLWIKRVLNGVAAVLALASGLVLGTRVVDRSTTEIIVGRSLGIDFGQAHKTLILVLRQDCEFCTASMPFYRAMLAARRSSIGPRLQLAVAAPARDTGIGAYLEGHGVVPDVLVQMAPGDLPATLAPTILLVDSRGTILEKWDGALTKQDEQRLLERLF